MRGITRVKQKAETGKTKIEIRSRKLPKNQGGRTDRRSD
jgi:hypothetical protein